MSTQATGPHKFFGHFKTARPKQDIFNMKTMTSPHLTFLRLEDGRGKGVLQQVFYDIIGYYICNDSLGTKSRSLHHSLSSKIDEIMKDASAVPVFKDGVLIPHLLQKARVTEYEIDRAALTITHAVVNPYYVDWDVDRYANAVKCSPVLANGALTQHDKIRKYFSKTVLGKISQPATIIDCNGKILMWHLPNILSPSRVNFINTTYYSL
ncbi:hypothetical protein EDD22DRAFT_852950 [Suillus occidentalis]|nr:hypothetical protein EDD22DRAFT_852950 [Suillus occidentalis]